jgi:hypothetical protein
MSKAKVSLYTDEFIIIDKSELQKNVQKRFNKKDSSIEEFKY